MRCPRCQADNLADSSYCGECGAPLEAVCPACRAGNGLQARFCRKCGVSLHGSAAGGVPPGLEPVVAEAPPSRAGGYEGERRQLTVLFCDLVESVALGERLDPEELHAVVRAYQKACAQVVRRHDGDVARYVGDGLLVYFGYPYAHENDPERAILAGLEIIAELGRLNLDLERSRHIRLAVRIGIHSGLVVVGECGGDDSGELQVLGHTVNLAARLQGVAEPDAVVISGATLHLVRGLFVTRELGALTLKGVGEPVPAYRALAPTGVRSRLDAAAAIGLTPFVGREPEIALVLDRWAEVVQGRGQSIVLCGEAGIGKSRLLRVLRERLAGAAHAWIEAHCSPYHAHSAFYPLAELLEQALRLRRDDPPEAKLAALEPSLAATGLPVSEVSPLFASLLAINAAERYPAVTVSADVQRRRTVESLITWLLARGAQGPAALVMEDLHWIDPSTRELLGLLVERVPEAPILLLCTSRPTPEPYWPGRSHLTQLTLHPLTRQQVGAMIEQIAAGHSLPARLRRQVVSKTDGVPLFVEELTKAVLESDLLRATAPARKRAAGRGEFEIPSTLQDSLTARLDRLGPSKELAQVGAVLGREFSHDLLAAVAPTDAPAVEQALRELVRSELVYQRGTPPQVTYRFKHALVQEAAYQSLLRSHRQETHARAARVLAQRFPQRAAAEPEEMARHCVEGGLTAEAVGWYRQAGGRAAARSAHAEAVAYLTRGLEVVAALPEEAERNRLELELRVALGPPLIAVRGYGDPEVERTYERARALCQAIDRAPHLFEAVWGLANYYQSRSQLGVAQDLAEQLVAIAERADDARLVVWAHLQLGATLFWRGDAFASLSHLEVAIARHDPAAAPLLTGTSDPGVAARVYAALALWLLGWPERALTMSREGVAVGRACGDAFSLALALCFSASLHRLRREPDAVRAQAEEVIALATQQDFPLWQGLGRMLRGWAMAHSGAAAEGLEEIQQGLAQLATTGTEVGASGGLVLLAEAARAAGRTPEALHAVEAGLALAELRQQHTSDGELLRLRGDLALESDDAGGEAEAERCFRRALETSRGQQATMFELRAATSFGRLLRRHGRGAEARALLEDIYRRFSEGFDTPDLREARALLAEL